ncbi:MAG: hypothetical protein HC807_06150, partial [Gammaproteobacteria bacterium]|nr:hypothetical protein [Gammaproteobacteria bacterium]
MYELAHEALLRGWDTLRRFCDQDAESHLLLERLQAAASEWQRLGQSREALWGAPQLKEAQTVTFDLASLAPRERQVLTLSRQARATRQRLKKVIALVGPALLLVLFGMARQSA